MYLYVAARYSRKQEVAEDVVKFRAAGHIVTSTWFKETEFPPNVSLRDQEDEFKKECAFHDLLEIDASDVLIFYSEDTDSAWVRGGRHVEYGYALAKNKTILVLGPKENTFHYVLGVKHFSTLTGILEELFSLEEESNAT